MFEVNRYNFWCGGRVRSVFSGNFLWGVKALLEIGFCVCLGYGDDFL